MVCIFFFLFLILFLFPINDPYIIHFKKLYKVFKLISFTVCLISILVSIIFKDNDTIAIVLIAMFVTIELSIYFSFYFYARNKFYNILKERIKTISNFKLQTNQEIRELLIQHFDEIYTIEEIKKGKLLLERNT